MNYAKILVLYKFLWIVPLLLFWSCQPPEESVDQSTKKETEPPDVTSEAFVDQFLKKMNSANAYVADLQDILDRDTLKAISIYSSTSYFLYKGEPMGYEYELARRLADHLDVELEMVVAHNMDDIIPMLLDGKGDVITYGLTITGSRNMLVDFTLPLNFTHQVLVQRKPDNWRKMRTHEIERMLMRNPIQMIDLPISVRKNSSYRERLENLEKELGGNINIQYLPGDLSTEEILRMVSDKNIDYTVADYNIASINAAYYLNLDIKTTVGVMQRLAWAVRKTSPELKKKVDDWITEQRKESDFYVIYNKYFKNQRAFTTRVKSEFFSMESGKISKYDDLIKTTAQSLGWDWRFLASQVYQESRFDPKSKSWAGAVGLLQLMPKTAKKYGYFKLTRPKSSLQAGTKHIAFLNEFWKEDIPDSTERVKFILASYNAGQYHVQDARRLAKKHGYDPNIWFDNVEKAMLMKSQKKHFSDPIVRYGYCRGEEPVDYVREILERYNYYTEFVGDPADENRFVSSR